MLAAFCVEKQANIAKADLEIECVIAHFKITMDKRGNLCRLVVLIAMVESQATHSRDSEA